MNIEMNIEGGGHTRMGLEKHSARNVLRSEHRSVLDRFIRSSKCIFLCLVFKAFCSKQFPKSRNGCTERI